MGWGKKNQEVVLFSAVDLKIFRSLNCPEIYGWQTCNWEETNQNAWHETEPLREKKREGEEEGRRESRQEEGTTWADVPLLTHEPTFLYSIYKPAAWLDAKHPGFSDFSAEDLTNFAAHM